jgi:hypothetical protein
MMRESVVLLRESLNDIKLIKRSNKFNEGNADEEQ